MLLTQAVTRTPLLHPLSVAPSVARLLNPFQTNDSKPPMPAEHHRFQQPQSLTHRVPPEILAIIFVCARNSQIDFWKRIDDHYTFMRVCRYWYEVADGSPELWSEIGVETYRDYKGLAHPVRRLHKSKRCPIQVYIKDQDTLASSPRNRKMPSLSSSRYLSQLYTPIVPHLERAEVIEVLIRSSKSQRVLFPLPGGLSSLVRLTLDLPGNRSAAQCITSECDSPLETLSITGCNLSGISFDMYPLRQLRGLWLDELLPRDLPEPPIQLITRAPNIEHICYGANDRVGAPPEDLVSISTPFLNTMIIGAFHLEDVRSWAAPALKTLHLLGEVRNWRNEAIHFPNVSLLSVVTTQALPLTVLRNLLSAFPLLRRLRITDLCSKVEMLGGLLCTPLLDDSSSSKEDQRDGASVEVEARPAFLCPVLESIALITSLDNEEESKTWALVAEQLWVSRKGIRLTQEHMDFS